MESRFSLFRRKDRGGQYYAQLWNDDTGHYMTARSTGKTTRNAALLVVSGWLRDGWPTGPLARPRPVAEAVAFGTILGQLRTAALTAEDAGRILSVLRERDLIDGGAVAKGGPGSELFTDFLTRFWTWEESPYVREKLAHGQQIGKRRCVDALGRRRAHWAPHFAGRRLASITRADLSDFGIALAEVMAPKSVNNCLEIGTVALRWAAHNGLLPADPTAGLRRFSGKAKARGVLAPEEAAALFRLPWKDERARVGSLLAATTGLRNGEVLAVRVQDIGEDRLFVRHSWSEVEGLKATKTGEERTVPLLPAVRAELLALAATNPHGTGDDAFVFCHADPSRPMSGEMMLRGLDEALVALTLPNPEDRQDPRKARAARAGWKARGVCFHSWRHFFASRMSDVADERTVRLATGHASTMMHEHYSSHATEGILRQAADAAAEVFAGVVVPFVRGEAAVS